MTTENRALRASDASVEAWVPNEFIARCPFDQRALREAMHVHTFLATILNRDHDDALAHLFTHKDVCQLLDMLIFQWRKQDAAFPDVYDPDKEVAIENFTKQLSSIATIPNFFYPPVGAAVNLGAVLEHVIRTHAQAHHDLLIDTLRAPENEAIQAVTQIFLTLNVHFRDMVDFFNSELDEALNHG
jgi:hypothetical protein